MTTFVKSPISAILASTIPTQSSYSVFIAILTPTNEVTNSVGDATSLLVIGAYESEHVPTISMHNSTGRPATKPSVLSSRPSAIEGPATIPTSLAATGVEKTSSVPPVTTSGSRNMMLHISATNITTTSGFTSTDSLSLDIATPTSKTAHVSTVLDSVPIAHTTIASDTASSFPAATASTVSPMLSGKYTTITVSKFIVSTSQSPANPSTSTGNSKDDDHPDGTGGLGNTDGSANTAGANGSSAGIGVGVVVGAIAYGAGMFWIARHYRRRRRLRRHGILTSGEGNFGTAIKPPNSEIGRSTRPLYPRQKISAPLESGNSLGW
ncbi:hypothetical protein N7539_008070 [Penicillium diatomitis]|uniref:Mid2 domain-containing protein n=1 Tax=Penicillium diatomitis TaxID=2819901 RepID=A0A9X0BMX8_9EURO|nr:uncharacterized protein N7539_008070 [Penicillium diatomitis]KAJ5475004.1 hypothetical protein N7539_008070 [Penicillium diatomitis]